MSQKIFMLLAIGLLLGCGKPMVRVPVDITPAEDSALVTFLRPLEIGEAEPFELWANEEFVGIIPPKSIVQYNLPPGEHYLLARGSNWSVLHAFVAAGDQYYVEVRPAVHPSGTAVTLAPLSLEDRKAARLPEWMSRLTAYRLAPELPVSFSITNPRQVRQVLLKAKQGQLHTKQLGEAPPPP